MTAALNAALLLPEVCAFGLRHQFPDFLRSQLPFIDVGIQT